jgi:DNA-binding transcriptional regulator YhcF (GntR family)
MWTLGRGSYEGEGAVTSEHALGLAPLDLNILLQLMKHQWSEALPFPSKKSVAACIGVQPRTVQRRIAAMEQAGLVERIARKGEDHRQQTNRYSFDGLIKRAAPYADQLLEERDERKKARESHYGKTQRSVSKKGAV